MLVTSAGTAAAVAVVISGSSVTVMESGKYRPNAACHSRIRTEQTEVSSPNGTDRREVTAKDGVIATREVEVSTVLYTLS